MAPLPLSPFKLWYPFIASFFGDQGYLVNFWLTKLFHDFDLKKFELEGVRSWLHKGKVLAPFMFVVLYENLSTLFYFYAINYMLFLKMEWMVNRERKKKPSYVHFYWFGRTRSFAYVPVRDQNLVVRGKNYRLIGFVFLISFWKRFWKKKPSGKWVFVCVFYAKRKWLKIELHWFGIWLRK